MTTPTILEAECLFNVPNPYDTTEIFSDINTWFVKNLYRCGEGDVIFLFTDYIIFDDEMDSAMTFAINQGAKLIMGMDRTQCGGSGKYVCGAEHKTNWCCSDISSNPPKSCSTCYICKGFDCCSFWRRILELPALKPLCGNRVLALDTRDDSQDFTSQHTHRKIVSFYRKKGRPSSIFKGSWNVNARNQLSNNGLRETGVGMTADTSSDVIQYFLRMDLDSLLFLQNSVNTPSTGQKAQEWLRGFQTVQKYPSLPIRVNLVWSGRDPSSPSAGAPLVGGIETNCEMWLGISPSPSQPSIPYSGKHMAQNQINTADFAQGNVWAGTVLQKFFDTAKTGSRTIKVQMYMGALDGSDPAYYSNTAYLPFVPYELVDFIKTHPENTASILAGNFREPGGPDPASYANPNLPPPKSADPQNDMANWWFLQKINDGTFGLSQSQKQQLFFRHFQTFATWPATHFCNGDYNCKYYNNCNSCVFNSIGKLNCCHAHDKFYVSDVAVNFSSGHWLEGYYNDPNWLNDDCMILSSKPNKFTNFWNSWFNVVFALNGGTFDQNPKQLYTSWDRDKNNNAPPAFNCHLLNDLGLISPAGQKVISKLNCFPNFPTTHSTEDIYKEYSYGSYDPPIRCPTGMSAQRGSPLTEGNDYELFCAPTTEKQVTQTTLPPVISLTEISSKFSKDGILVFMHSATGFPDLNKSYQLDRCVHPSPANTQFNCNTTILQKSLPINIYVGEAGNIKNIGLILDLEKLSPFIRCSNVMDGNSANRKCSFGGYSGCKPPADGVYKCDSKNTPDFQAIQAGCGVHTGDSSGVCNTVKWCDSFSAQEIEKKYESKEWDQFTGCVFKNPDSKFLQSARNFRTKVPQPAGYAYLETEVDLSFDDLSAKTAQIFHDSILGVFTPASATNCACGPNEYAPICGIHCLTESLGIVKRIARAYNEDPRSTRRIQAYELRNTVPDKYNGWENPPSQPQNDVQLENFLVAV